jgi:hypothetical protein
MHVYNIILIIYIIQMISYLATRECGIFTNVFNIPKELRGTSEQYLHEEKVVAINGLLFNYAMGLFPPDVTESIQKKLVEHDLPRLDGNRYGAIDKGFTIIHGGKEIKLNHPLGLCEAYAAWRYAKFTHTDKNFLDHAIAACCLRGIQLDTDPDFSCHDGDFDGGNFYMAEYGILLKMTGTAGNCNIVI